MDRNFIKLIALFLFMMLCHCTLCSPVSAHTSEKQIIRLATGEWPPYTSSFLYHLGLASRIVTESFALEGYRVEYEFFPWKRSFALAKAGLYDGTFPWRSTALRKQQFFISEPVIDTEIVFFHRKDFNFTWEEIIDLKYLHLGTTRGYAYADNFRPKLKRIGIRHSDSDTDLINLKLLLNGRIDLFPLEKDVGTFLLNKYLHEVSGRITYHRKPLVRSRQSILFSKTSAENERLNKIFNKGLQRLKDSGRYQTILSQKDNQRVTLKVAIAHWPPWIIIHGSTLSGVDVEILREVETRLGFTLQFVTCPWQRCIEMVKSGSVDIVTSFAKTKEMEEFVDYLGPSYASDDIVFFKRSDSEVTLFSYRDLSRYKIGTSKGSSYFEPFDNDTTLHKIPLSETEQLTNMLCDDRVDLIIGFEKALTYTINQQGYQDDLVKLPFHIPAVTSYFAISKQSKELHLKETLSKTIKKIINTGKIERIMTSLVNPSRDEHEHHNGSMTNK